MSRKLGLIGLKPLIFRSQDRDLHKNLNVPRALANFGLAYRNLEQYDLALDFYSQAFSR
ncbi:MAG: hypothetical protein ICV55_15400 [Coleofasciculus sp. C3-bin4]|nr:hypothetical protein [Coleofasciculus sp. C3-bin4]